MGPQNPFQRYGLRQEIGGDELLGRGGRGGGGQAMSSGPKQKATLGRNNANVIKICPSNELQGCLFRWEKGRGRLFETKTAKQ